MPFRLTNATTTFQQLMEACLRDVNLNWCIIYLDDIATLLKDPISHLMRLEAMFKKLEHARQINTVKCKFCQQITYLGHVSTQGNAANGK